MAHAVALQAVVIAFDIGLDSSGSVFPRIA
jgi:hypothetical protein